MSYLSRLLVLRALKAVLERGVVLPPTSHEVVELRRMREMADILSELIRDLEEPLGA